MRPSPRSDALAVSGQTTSAANSISDERSPPKVRKVSRACDFCKSRKAKCSGSHPCSKCAAQRRPCFYNAKYTRGRPPTPPQAPGIGIASGPETLGNRTSTGAVTSQPAYPRRSCDDDMAGRSQLQSTVPSRGSPELGVAEIHGQVFDTTSSLTFLHRVWKRLSAENTHSMSDVMTISAENQPLIMAGDKPLTDGDSEWGPPVLLPSPSESRMLVSLYFDLCVATYRFLYRPFVEKWLAIVERNVAEGMPVWSDIGHARAAIVIAVLAMAMEHHIRPESLATAADEERALRRSDQLFKASTHLTDAEVGYPKLESVQARLIQVLYLLTTSRFNWGWYVFGNTLQIISAIGLHRREGAKRRRIPRTDYIHAQFRMRTFWSAYIMDNHLGVIFGRPRHFHDEDVDQDFPDCVNDEDMTAAGPSNSASGAPEECHVNSLIFHAKIAQIIGSISREVYTVKGISEQERTAAAGRLIQDIHEWHSSLPLHLRSIPPSILIPSYRRQATVMKLAHAHAIMHVTRLFLLSSSPHASSRVGECVSAALSVLQTVDKMVLEGPIFRSFWWTHYVTFCALVVVYVWVIQRRRLGLQAEVAPSAQADDRFEMLQLANRCQTHLARATATNSPIRRYAVILEEFQVTATGRQRGADTEQAPSGNDIGQPVRPGYGQSHTVAGGVATQAPVTGTGADDAASLDLHILDEWQTTDWLDLDSSLFWHHVCFDEFIDNDNRYMVTT